MGSAREDAKSLAKASVRMRRRLAAEGNLPLGQPEKPGKILEQLQESRAGILRPGLVAHAGEKLALACCGEQLAAEADQRQLLRHNKNP